MQQALKTTITIILILSASAAAFAWPIPDTGQTRCYDNEKEIPCPKPGEPFYGQDGNYSINPMSYTKLDDRGRELADSASEWAMVRDNVTGLVWEVKTDDGSVHDRDDQYNWEEAQSGFIARLNREKFGGYSDWRMPGREELRSIVDYGRANPSIDKIYFPECVSSNYWSSTTYASNTYDAWGVNFYDGYGSYYSKSSSRYVRAVRGGQGRPLGPLVIHEDGTATDQATGLMWQTGEAGEMTWEAALAYTERLSLAGYADWRLPTVKELASLAKLDSNNPAADNKVFTGINSSDYWSSTTGANNTYSAWYVNFSSGNDDSGSFKSGSRYVRAVRGGQGGLLAHSDISQPDPPPPAVVPPAPVPDTTPPVITILEPRTQRGIIRRKEDRIPVKGTATDSSGVQQVRINGTKVPLRDNGHFEALVMLGTGDNRITVKATDTRNNTATETFTVSRAADPPAIVAPVTPAAPTLKGWYAGQYAVVVGIDIYRNSAIPPLRNAVNDAEAVAEMFSKKMGFNVTELYGSRATRTAIIRAIAAVQEKAGKNDGFVFYFAGHGQGIELKNKDLQGYIIPYDADLDLESSGAILFDEQAISLSRLRTYAQDFSAKHTALILDSCFSGLAMQRTIPRFPPMTEDYYNDLLARKAINILTAGDAQPVSDGTGHSPFTKALLNALDRANIDLHDRDGFATFNQLAVYVKEKVEKATGRRQRPQFDNLSMDDGEFVFQVR